jgi:hypothetical protein
MEPSPPGERVVLHTERTTSRRLLHRWQVQGTTIVVLNGAPDSKADSTKVKFYHIVSNSFSRPPLYR